jgi:hypothetical protein
MKPRVYARRSSNLRFEHDSGYVVRRDGVVRVDSELLVY